MSRRLVDHLAAQAALAASAELTASTLTDASHAALYPSDLHYLQDELRWIQARAERIHTQQQAQDAAIGAGQSKSWKTREGAPLEQLQRRAAALCALEDQIRAQIDQHLQAHRAAGQPVALDRLTSLYGLDTMERNTLLLAAAMGCSTSFRDVCEQLAPSRMASSLEVEVLFNFHELDWRERVLKRAMFAPSSRLCANHLVTVSMGSRLASPEELLHADIQIAPQTFAYLCGVEGLDDGFSEFSSLEAPKVTLDQVVLPERDLQRLRSVVLHHSDYLKARADWGFDNVIRYGRGVVLLFHGAPGTGKTMTAHALAHALGKRVLNVDLPTFVGSKEADRFLPALFREAKIHNALLFFDECETLFADRARGNMLMTLLLTELERFDGVAILATNLPQLLDDALDRRMLVKVRFGLPDRAARKAIWQQHLPATAPLADDVNVDALADRFEMAGGYIKNAVLLAVAEAAHVRTEQRPLTMAMFESAAEAQLQRPREERMNLVQPTVRLADVVLPPALRAEVEELLASARNRRSVLRDWGIGQHLSGLGGVAALLHGEPGTGKTLCAEAIAHELCKPLLVAQVPTLLSKWVGGTESNLQALFAEAKSEDAVLLLDECDALLGKRAPDSRRHEVSTVNVLLGLLERFDGVVLLATNRPQELDSALGRRMGWVLHFAKPDIAARLAIWRGLLPPTVPVQGQLDLGLLAHLYPLAGGHIRNAVLRAAMRAAHRGDGLRMSDLLTAADQQAEAAGLAAQRSKLPTVPVAEG